MQISDFPGALLPLPALRLPGLGPPPPSLLELRTLCACNKPCVRGEGRVRGTRMTVRGRGKNQRFHPSYSMKWRNGKGKHTISLLSVLETYGTEHVMQDVLSREFLTYRMFTAMVWELEKCE